LALTYLPGPIADYFEGEPLNRIEESGSTELAEVPSGLAFSDCCFAVLSASEVGSTKRLTSIPTRYAGAIRTWRSTPILRAAGFEDEDENEALGEGCGRAVNADFHLLRLKLCATKLSTMNRSAAEENLRVIRELMERATIYRAVSAPGALFCGLSALLVSALALIPGPFQTLVQHNFALVWVVVCLLSVTANIFFLIRATDAAPGKVCFLSITDRFACDRACLYSGDRVDVLSDPRGGYGTLYRGLLDGVIWAGTAVDNDICPPVNRHPRLGVHPDQRSDPGRDGAGIGTRCVRPVKPGDGTSRLLRHGWELRSLSHDFTA